MRKNWLPDSAESYSNFLFNLREKRQSNIRKKRITRSSRTSLSKRQRTNILKKTNSRCHICGGAIRGKWQADHVFPHATGGEQTEDNYLPAHPSCNNYRWSYDPSEMLEIIKLGIWLRTQIINQSVIGMEAAERFIKYEEQRHSRRKPSC